MKRHWIGAATLLAISAVTAGFGLGGGDDTAYARLDANAEPLRSAFNADIGKVRVLMLVAPT